MKWLNPRQKAAIIQHMDALETLINHVAEQERLREEHEQARKQAIARMRRKGKRSVWVKLTMTYSVAYYCVDLAYSSVVLHRLAYKWRTFCVQCSKPEVREKIKQV